MPALANENRRRRVRHPWGLANRTRIILSRGLRVEGIYQNIRGYNARFNGHRRKGRDDAMSLWLRGPTQAILGQTGG